MPALRVSVDGETIATVSTDGLNVLSVRVSGTLIDESYASLEISGGTYPEKGESTHLIWVSELPLRQGQKVSIAMLESAQTSHSGKTIDELFPDKDDSETTNIKSRVDVFCELRSKPKFRERFGFRFESSQEVRFSGQTYPDEHGFGFTVLWDSWRSDSARVSLHSYTLHSLEHQEPMTDHVEQRIHAGDSVLFELVT